MLTTHYLDEAEELADRIAVIAAGRVVASGDPRSLGGRATADAHVSWDEPDTAGRPPSRRKVQTPTPTRLVTELAARFAGEIPGLTVTRPSLEDIYLDLITEADHDQES